MKPARKLALTLVAAVLFAFAASLIGGEAADDASDEQLRTAVGPIVYRLDESPSAHGYHYTFFGNGFFINDQGYLLTVAHVLETFHNGGEPSIQVIRPNRPPQLLPLTLVAADTQHDVAILRATPNPFASRARVTFLSLATEAAVPGQVVLAISLHPAQLQSAQSFQMPIESRSPGEVLSYESTPLEKSAPATEVFLLSHPVTLGQSGSPVLDSDSHAVVGLIEGRWLRPSGIAFARAAGGTETPGAAIPIRYAIALLDEKGITWHSSGHDAGKIEPPAKP